MKNSFTRLLVISAIQIIAFILVCEIALKVRHYFFESTKPDLSWGLTYRYSIYIISFIVISGNFVFNYFLNKVRYSNIILLVVSLIVFLSFFAKGIKYTPYKTGLLILSALIALLIKYFIDRKTTKRAN